MARAYSSDLRERVIGEIEDGATRREAAERFGVSVASAIRWHQTWRHDSTIEARPNDGNLSPLDDYAEEIVAAMHKRRIPGSRTALFR